MRSSPNGRHGVRASALTWLTPALTAETTRLLGLAILVGSLSGLLAILFWHAIALLDEEAVRRAVDWLAATFGAPFGNPALWHSLFPAVGALLMAVLVVKVFRTPERLGVAGIMLDARTSIRLARTFSRTGPSRTRPTTGKASVRRAMGPCFISPAG